MSKLYFDTRADEQGGRGGRKKFRPTCTWKEMISTAEALRFCRFFIAFKHIEHACMSTLEREFSKDRVPPTRTSAVRIAIIT